MARKQIKLTVDEKLYKKLADLAKKNKLPISSYIRSLVAANIGADPSLGSETPARSTDSTFTPESTQNTTGSYKDEKEDVILLSDIISGNSGRADNSEQTLTVGRDHNKEINLSLQQASANTGSANPDSNASKPVNIKIVIV